MALFSAQYLKEGVSAREALSWALFALTCALLSDLSLVQNCYPFTF